MVEKKRKENRIIRKPAYTRRGTVFQVYRSINSRPRSERKSAKEAIRYKLRAAGVVFA